jgi:drug/metabolite transporter (DMT)-like permease
MEGLGVLLVVVAAFIANLPALREQWRTDRAGSIKTIWLFGVYLLYIGLGIVVVLLLAPREGGHEDKAPYLSGFIVGFILYGGLTLMRVVPRYREPPAWLMHDRRRGA